MVSESEVDEIYKKALQAVEALELMNMLRQKEDPMDCVLKINSGAGGTESRRLGVDVDAPLYAMGRVSRTQSHHK